MLGSLRDFSRRLLRWYKTHRRDLPWRPAPGAATPHPDPYRVLVSEAMLQQTQVATVIPYFQRFLERFPTLPALAAAPEQDVLRLWQGLGYYSRARNLQKAARVIVDQFAGTVPDRVDQLLQLPGIGRYTAGAIASIAFGRRAPILDGNVIRVLCRLDCIQDDPAAPATRTLLWDRAEQILPQSRLSEFNSALMELGALVCVPRTPACLLCPVQAHCQALAAGQQQNVPKPKTSKPTPLVRRWTFCIQHNDRYLIEQRPPTGRWAGLWQFITLPAMPGVDPFAALAQELNPPITPGTPLGQVRHGLTHRQYVFDVYRATVANPTVSPPRLWMTLDELAARPLPKPHVRIREMLLVPSTSGRD